jgi:hypothetical protein
MNKVKLLFSIVIFLICIPLAPSPPHPGNDDLYLIVRKDHRPLLPLPEWGEIIFAADNKALVRSEQPPYIADYPAGYHILKISEEQEKQLRGEIEGETGFLNYEPAVLNTPVVSALISSLQVSGLENYISHLENYRTRFFLHPNRYQITSWLTGEFHSYGFTEVTVDSFYIDEYNWGNFPPVWQSNVIARLEGTTYPDHYILIGGHYDSIISPQFGDPMETAPGADDNASGTAALLEIAGILRENNYQPKKSLLFVPFGAEEIGLMGSRYYSRKLRNEGYELELMLNNDMIAYTPPDNDDWKVKIFPYGGYTYLALLAANIFEEYTLVEPEIRQYNNPASDSYPFYEQGYPSLFFHEYNFSPYYHRPEDLLSNCDVAYALEITKASLLTMLYFDNIPVKVTGISFTDAGDGREVIAGWNYPVPSEISHYNIYLGNSSGEYPEVFSTTEQEFSLSGLQEGQEYFAGISAVDLNGQEGVITEMTFIPSSLPQTPANFSVSSFRDHVILSWTGNTELDLAGYNIYRSSHSPASLPELYLENYPDTLFADYDLENFEYYYYTVTALDLQGNESEPAEMIKTRLFSLCRGILLLNAAPGGDGSFLMPEKETLFRYYDFLLGGFRFNYLTLADVSGLSPLDIAPYSSLILCNDTILSPVYLPSLKEALKEYLDKGGNLLLSGFNPLSLFTGDISYPQEFGPDSFVYQYLGIESAYHYTGSYFRSALPVSPVYPGLETDTAKTLPALDYHLFNIAGFHNTTETEAVYLYHSGYSPDTPAGAMQNSITGIEHKNPAFKTVTLSFPLYFMKEADVSALLNHLLPELFLEKPWEIEAETGKKKRIALLPSYPNPFRRETVIPFYLENEGKVRIEIFNIKGKKIKTLYDGAAGSGRNKIVWDGRNNNEQLCPTGIYLLKLSQGNQTATGKLLLLK